MAIIKTHLTNYDTINGIISHKIQVCLPKVNNTSIDEEYWAFKEILSQRVWNWTKKIVRNCKKFNRMYKLIQGQKRQGSKYKLELQVPRTKKEAIQLDLENENTF